jgi:hypothetical protein
MAKLNQIYEELNLFKIKIINENLFLWAKASSLYFELFVT